MLLMSDEVCANSTSRFPIRLFVSRCFSRNFSYAHSPRHRQRARAADGPGATTGVGAERRLAEAARRHLARPAQLDPELEGVRPEWRSGAACLKGCA
eukprot:4245930-Pleurochrysis_carterae.AAC.1